jgi:hypothetical protein
MGESLLIVCSSFVLVLLDQQVANNNNQCHSGRGSFGQFHLGCFLKVLAESFKKMQLDIKNFKCMATNT